MSRPIASNLVARLSLAGLVLFARGPARAEPAPTVPVRLGGVGNGITLLPDPYFKWTPAPKEPRAGVMGRVAGPTREFENIELEVGCDRRVLTGPIRAGYEAYRIRRDVERGEAQKADVKPELVVVRIQNAFREAVYVTGVKQLGRTSVFVRGTTEKRLESALVRVVASIATTARGPADEVNGWIPPEVKATWTSAPAGELLVVDDGTVDAAAKASVVRVVEAAFALTRRVVGGTNVASFAPVVRLTANRDLFTHLAGRRDLASASAFHLDVAAELLVCVGSSPVDEANVAAEASKLALHHLTGVADAEPVRTGLARMAAAAAAPGAAPGALLSSGADAALARARKKEATSWFGFLMMGTLAGFLAQDAATRALDAELSVGYLAAGGPIAKTSIAAWVAGLRKWGHVDAGAEAGVAPIDGVKADAEYWAYWTPRADPPKKPGKPGAK